MHVRYGCRPVHVLLCREGWHFNLKNVIASIASYICNSGTKRPSAW